MYTLVERERNQWCESSVPLKGQTREEVEQYRRYERKKTQTSIGLQRKANIKQGR